MRKPSLQDVAAWVVRGVLPAAVLFGGAAAVAWRTNQVYALSGWLIWRLLWVAGWALVFNLCLLLFGSAVLRLLWRGEPSRRGDEWLPGFLAVRFGAGLSVFGAMSYVVGAVVGFSALSFTGLVVGLGVLGLYGLPTVVDALRNANAEPRETRSTLGHFLGIAATAFGIVGVGMLYAGTLDLSSFNFDAKWYHVPLAQDYARLGVMTAFPGENHKAYPHLMSMVHTWALLVPGFKQIETRWLLSLQLELSFVLWRIVGVAGLMRWMLGGRRVPGLWAVFFLFPSVFIYDQAIGGSADHLLGMFAAPLCLAMAQAIQQKHWRWAAVAGILLGGHLLSKYQAVYLTVAVALALIALGAKALWDYRLGDRHALRAWASMAAAGAVAAAVVSAPHFIKNSVFYGNPIYPLGQKVFARSHPVQPQGFYEEQPQPGAFAPKYEGPRRQLWVAETLFTYSFETRNRGLTKHRPYMGSLFSILLPTLAFIGAPRRRIGFVVCLGVAAFWVWANTAPNDRYMLAFLDLFIAVSGALMVRLATLGWLARAGLVAATGMQLFWGGDAAFFYGKRRAVAALELVTKGYESADDGKRFAHQRDEQELTKAIPRNAVVLARNYRDLLGVDRTFRSDVRVAQGALSYSHMKSSRDFWAALRDQKITHMAYPPGRRRPSRLNNVVLFDALFQECATEAKRVGALRFGKLCAEAPPAEPLMVLVKKARGYPDGLYSVDQLDIDDADPKRFSPRPVPLERLTSENDVALLERATAVFRTTGGLSVSAEALLAKNFSKFETFKSEEVWLRKRAGLERNAPVEASRAVEAADDDDDEKE